MEAIEIKAEVFRLVRANIDKPKKEIVRLMYEHLKGISKGQIMKALMELWRETV